MARVKDTVSIAEKVIELTEQFNRYVFAYPDVLDQIPDGALLVFLDVDDPEFNAANLRLAEETQQRSAGNPIYIALKKRTRLVEQVEWSAEIWSSSDLLPAVV